MYTLIFTQCAGRLPAQEPARAAATAAERWDLAAPRSKHSVCFVSYTESTTNKSYCRVL